LRTALLPIAAGTPKGEIDPQRLGGWMKRVRDKVVKTFRLQQVPGRKVHGVSLWQIATTEKKKAEKYPGVFRYPRL
jgi:hypothetical protein